MTNEKKIEEEKTEETSENIQKDSENTETLEDVEVSENSKETETAEESAEHQLEALKDQHLRLMAEYDNYRKRTVREKENLWQNAKVDTVRAFLNIYDSLQRAMDTLKEEDSTHKKGIELIFRQYKEVLEKLGVKEMEALGLPFDPEKHEAVMHITDENRGENEISQVFQAGFTLNDCVIRPATVQVAN